MRASKWATAQNERRAYFRQYGFFYVRKFVDCVIYEKKKRREFNWFLIVLLISASEKTDKTKIRDVTPTHITHIIDIKPNLRRFKILCVFTQYLRRS